MSWDTSLLPEQKTAASYVGSHACLHVAPGTGKTLTLARRIVFLTGAEDEYIPGRQIGEEEWDARRLLYVSLTRARHVLLITQCQKRIGNQQYTGRVTGQHRQMSRFLHDYPIVAENTSAFAKSLTRPLQLLPTAVTPVEDLDFCFIDLETTGLDPTKDRVCEIPLVKTRLYARAKRIGSFSKLTVPLLFFHPPLINAAKHYLR